MSPFKLLKSLACLFITAAFVLGCSDPTSTRKAPNGFEFQVIRPGEGDIAGTGLYLVMNMVYQDDKDSVWFDTQKLGRPGVIMVPDTAMISQEKGMESVFRALKKGDSIKFKVGVRSLFDETWRTAIPPGVSPDGSITFFIGVKDVTNREGVMKLQEELQKQEFEKNKKLQASQLAADIAAIDAWLASHGVKAQSTPEGLRYVITTTGVGESPVVSNTIIANYKGSLMENGAIFDQGPLEYPLSDLIQGWQIGFQKLNRGAKATFYIPSTLGYGSHGSPPQIPANANLIFEVELIDFK